MPQCKVCQASFNIRAEDQAFYERMQVPPPKACPDCRMQQRMNFRNERNLYKRKSSMSGKDIISIYHESSPYKVYATDEWWSDKWDGADYGRDFDFKRTFFEQFQELVLDVPRIALFNINPTNSDFCQQAYNNKNCYLCTVITECEDSMYVSHTNRATDSYDCDYVQNVELCVDCLDSDKLYECVSCQSCQNSSNLIYCYDCIGCQNCFGCSGLRNQKYHIFNKPYSPEEYKEKIASLEINKYSNYVKYKNHFKEIAQKADHKENWNLNTENSLGNYLINSKNCYMCFDSFEMQDSAYCTWTFESNNIQDVYGMGKCSWVYNSLGVENLNMGAFNTFVSDSGDAMYSDCSFYSMNIFGCAGLRNKKNHILNKAYSPEEYAVLKTKIIEHMQKTNEWGEFFPTRLSPFGYDESVAIEHFPLTKEEVLEKGLKWSGYEKIVPDVEKTITSSQVPDDIKEVTDDLLNWAIKCEISGKLFKIQKLELDFYRKNNLPIQRYHPDVRYEQRMSLRNPKKLWDRNCDECNKSIQTTYSPEKPEKVLCEECYLKRIN